MLGPDLYQHSCHCYQQEHGLQCAVEMRLMQLPCKHPQEGMGQSVGCWGWEPRPANLKGVQRLFLKCHQASQFGQGKVKSEETQQVPILSIPY